MSYTKQDKEILQRLSERYMKIASLPVQKEKVELWKALNRGAMQRPMVIIDQLPWNELNEDGFLTCKVSDPQWRRIENSLRQTIYSWEHFPVDMVVEPFISLPMAIENSGFGITPEVESIAFEPSGTAPSQHFTNLLKEFEDIEKIKDPIVSHDKDKSKLILQEGRDIFEATAPVIQRSGSIFHLGSWDTISMLMGVQDIYYDFIDRPEFLHAIMERITLAQASMIEQYEALSLHDDLQSICHCVPSYTDELLPAPMHGRGPTAKNCWAFGLAQLFTSVSPACMAEFEIPYISRLAKYFGMLYYGCCDRLDDRLDIVKTIPNLKKVSCSPWSDRDHFAREIGTTLVMSNKPSPALLAAESFSTEEVRADLNHTYNAAKENGVNLEFILKDISTVRHEPHRLIEWAKTAMEVATQ